MRRAPIILVGLGALAVAVVTLRLLVGSGSFAWPAEPEVLNLRGSRAALGVIVGAALAVAGVLMQSLLRNPLASPDILGPSSGASLAVVLSAFLASASALANPVWSVGPALFGAFAALALVYALSQRRGIVSPAHLVLVGVVISVLCGAAVLLLQTLRPAAPGAIARQLMGALNDDLPRAAILAAAAATLVCTTLAVLLAPALDAATLDDDEARSLGLRLSLFRPALFALAGVLTATAVVLAGPVSFVGLVAPHAVRLALGPQSTGTMHRRLIVGSALAGSTLIVGADVLIRAIDLGSGRVPLGVLTALIGGPVLLLLLRANRPSIT